MVPACPSQTLTTRSIGWFSEVDRLCEATASSQSTADPLTVLIIKDVWVLVFELPHLSVTISIYVDVVIADIAIKYSIPCEDRLEVKQQFQQHKKHLKVLIKQARSFDTDHLLFDVVFHRQQSNFNRFRPVLIFL